MTLMAALEPAIKFTHRQLHPGWAAVIALSAALCGLHVAKQGVHLPDRQAPIGTH